MPMKILFSCLSESRGGMEFTFIETAELLRKKNIEVKILCFANSGIHKSAVEKDFKVYTASSTGYFNPVEIYKLKRTLKAENFDLVHTHFSKDLWLLVPALSLAKFKIPLILTKHVGSYIVKKDFLHRKIYSRLTKAISISNVISQNLVDTCPIGKDKVVLIPNWVDLEKFNPDKTDRRKVRAEFGILENEIVVGMSARFTPGKGHEELIEAASKIENKAVKYLIVGEASRGEDEYAAGIKKLVSEKKLENKFIFTGFRKDIPDVISAMDIFAFPSHAEAFGLALLEAMALGKPSVCTNSDGVLDIAVDGETSYLFEKKNAADLAEKLNRLLSSEEIRYRFGKAARKRAEINFKKEDQIEKLIRLYEKEIQAAVKFPDH